MFQDIVKAVPWWIYLILLYLFIVGLWSLHPRTISINRLFFLPILLMIWNIYWLSERLKGHAIFLSLWPIGLTFGSFFGWLTVRNWKISIDRSRNTLSLPPTWSTLILILSVFAIRYFFAFKYQAHPNETSRIFLADAIISGILTGTFIGRSYHLLQKYRNSILK